VYSAISESPYGFSHSLLAAHFSSISRSRS